MKKRIIITISLVGLALMISYVIWIDNLPPRTPQKVARIVSGLSIPRDAEILEFKDEWNNFNGDGFSLIILHLDNESFNNIYQESKLLQFDQLPLNDSIYGPLKDFANREVNGFYKIIIHDKNSMSFSGTVLSEKSNTVAVYIAVN
ncbi:hypothetical protein [Algoriphagus antarcticus]|uniref:Uncharacterized protein n=1 Tax=Algoriphagus antarcticus TaxID=238540 RepID=A0A3E0CZX0_9BACT|nr:hypothetical protein [Algoriphagus antarcticus]REG74751.1 hypothetical protein C8N25_1682 [Algoriphagus antarcticus]